METSSLPPKASRPTVEGDVLVSQVLEIIGGFSLQTMEGPEEKDLWSMEEGDDSVFYSDEDQAHQHMKANTSFGANECERVVNSLAADDDEDDPGEESIIDEEIAELKDVTQRVILTEQEAELQIVKDKTMDQSNAADPGAQINITPEKSLSICAEALNCSAEKVTLPVEKEEETPNIEPSDVTNEERSMRLNREADVSEQDCRAELQISGDRQLQDHNFQTVGFHQDHRPSYSTLPLPKKSCDLQKSFNHLSSSKYSTVSYRKIRRGNTRQKIEEFEYMLMNL